MTVLCKDCKHSRRPLVRILTYGFGKYSLECSKNYIPEEVTVDPVTGPKKTTAHYETCSLTRIQSKGCGEEGKWWEPKDQKKHFFTVIKHEAEVGKE